MKKILVLLATGFEEIEALSVVNVLRRANVSCDMGTLDSDYVKGTHNIEIKSDVNINNIDIDEYDGVVLPGGLPGAYNLRDSKKVREIVQKLNNDKKIIGAICAAPEALESFDILNGKKCTSYPGFIQEKNNVEYIENEMVVEDENIITSRGPATAIEFALEILRKLGYEKEYKEIKEGMLVNFYNEFK
ncbi:DJ-1/PfpI family protein [Paraclostridium ghonii]|uniref:4-methyl-5(B-hydroxyethyl)-thiazole monophosphate biosynthesis n=1 Tax=Paraclostridium ghonii TaxID=29358 RepID=A0ABU0N077_9FIRM|nr:DJ-1 family glyoxalase III [Paeniclostridium ghonii]MDQ0556116.1 4-methyl-5(b-hydroxyethyl)-thiazole monophosphate biosynthesis [Paeniclostridium ghonii]